MSFAITDRRIKIYMIEDTQKVAVVFDTVESDTYATYVEVDYCRINPISDNVYWDVKGATRVKLEYILKLVAGGLTFAIKKDESG